MMCSGKWDASNAGKTGYLQTLRQHYFIIPGLGLSRYNGYSYLVPFWRRYFQIYLVGTAGVQRMGLREKCAPSWHKLANEGQCAHCLATVTN